MGRSPIPRLFAALFILASAAGCVRSFALATVADAVAGSGGNYSSDDDPELIEAAAPFGLKTMEGILTEMPEHRGLLTGLVSGFTSYAYAFVEFKADEIADKDLNRSLELKQRAKKLYLRAFGYGVRGLDLVKKDFLAQLRKDPKATLALMGKGDVPLLYWTAAAWGAAISAGRNDPQLVADLPLVKQLAQRALELDEGFMRGAIHELFIGLETAAPGGNLADAKKHFDRAVEISQQTKASPFVTYAETISVKTQNAKEFHQLLEQALAIDIEKSPPDRLANVLMKRKAARLLAAAPDLFVDDEQAPTKESM
jgi:hypothetical protein